jgi:hypothetical protein
MPHVRLARLYPEQDHPLGLPFHEVCHLRQPCHAPLLLPDDVTRRKEHDGCPRLPRLDPQSSEERGGAGSSILWLIENVEPWFAPDLIFPIPTRALYANRERALRRNESSNPIQGLA